MTIRLIMLTLMLAALTACGKKGALEPPVRNNAAITDIPVNRG